MELVPVNLRGLYSNHLICLLKMEEVWLQLVFVDMGTNDLHRKTQPVIMRVFLPDAL